jgi:hypothetical protein
VPPVFARASGNVGSVPTAREYGPGARTSSWISKAMEAGVVSRLFSVMDLVNLLIESESEQAA